MRQQIKRVIYGAAAGLVVIVTITLLLGGKGDNDREKEKQKEETKISQEEAAEEKKQKTIKKVLKKDEYGKELAAVYKKYPQTEKLLLNREDYPDWLVKYFVGHTSAIEWVLAYPEHMEKPMEEINQAALEPVELKDYYSRGKIPVYYQWGEAWGYASYGEGTLAVDGCGPTCLSMVATGLTGDVSLTPKKVADISAASGFFVSGLGTDWLMMTQGAAQLGIYARQIENWTTDTILAELNAGNPVIASMGPGDFTSQGHFVVMVGVTADGKIIVNDPNSRVNTRKKWEPQRLLDQMKGGWAYSM